MGTVGTELLAGQPARVTAPNGLNLRDQPNTNGQLLLQLATNTKVSVLEGPSEGEGFTWWKVDDGQGNVGWVADSDGETEWLSPRLGEPQPVERAPASEIAFRLSCRLADSSRCASLPAPMPRW